MPISHSNSITIVGGGFTGLSCAYELAKAGQCVTLLESEDSIGGLAAAFNCQGEKLDCFYHHWFTNDIEVMKLIDELGLNDLVKINTTNTGVYYANNFFKLSTPWDLLNFTPLNLIDRLRLGLLALRARRVKDWHLLEDKSASDWLKELGGEAVFRVVWEPLLKGKFGSLADTISAVWFWNKLKLRGGSRGKRGEERLAYFKGSFSALAEALASSIVMHGGRIELKQPVVCISPNGNRWSIETADGSIIDAKQVVATPSLPLVADMVRGWAPEAYIFQLERINYLANVCLILELDRSLSETYWLNVNDPLFPFVGIIEHTNFECSSTYSGRHIIYLSKYLPHTDKLFNDTSNDVLEFAKPHLKRMFPAFEDSWILHHHLWKARWAQPVVEKGYARLIPDVMGPKKGFFLCSMAQIYPEDRGTNYAIREGRSIGRQLVQQNTV